MTRRAVALVVSGLVAACGAASQPAGPRRETPPPAPGVLAVLPAIPQGLARFATSVHREAVGPVVTTTLELTLPGEAAGQAAPEAAPGTEAVVEFTLSPGTFIGRMALRVEADTHGGGRWMEAEILSRRTATSHYESVVRPPSRRPRDPALLTEGAPGEWTLRVFPVPRGGERHVRLVLHAIEFAAPGAWFERRPALAADEQRSVWFALVPDLPPLPGSAPPASLILAVDTSLSMAPAMPEVVSWVNTLSARFPVEVVAFSPQTGAVGANACVSNTPCLDTETAGATDLGALLDAAFAHARLRPRSAVVLLSDGRPTVGTLTGEALAAGVRTRGEMRALHTVPFGRSDRRLLTRLAQVGHGRAAASFEGLTEALSRPFAPLAVQIVDGQVAHLGIVDGAVFGRLDGPSARVRVERMRGDGGASPERVEASLTPAEPPPTGFTLSRLAGAAALTGDPALTDDAALALARRLGIAANGAALLALETEADYTGRGIPRAKAAEQAALAGQPFTPIAAGALDLEVRPADRDGDGVPDQNDACPDAPAPEGDEGCPRRRVILEADQIRILDQVYFAPGSVHIRPQANPLLDEVAHVLRDHPEIEIVAVEGHTDGVERGAARLSRARADAVLAALVSRGVSRERLVPLGYGAERPMAPGRTRAARERNRRVGWTILATDRGVVSDPAGAVLLDAQRARFLLAAARAALDRGDRAAAEPRLVEALPLLPTPAARLEAFRGGPAEAFPERFDRAVEAVLTAGAPFPDALLDAAMARTPGLVASTPGLRLEVERRALAYLADLRPAAARRAASPKRLAISADILVFLGRPTAARIRRDELIELIELDGPGFSGR